MYYLWLNEAQAGPFTIGQVQNMWNQGSLTALNLYWQEGMAEWRPLGEIIAKIEPRPKTQQLAQGVPEIAPMPTPRTRTLVAATLPVYENDTMAAPREQQANVEKVLWEGGPSLWHFAAHFIIGLLTLPLLIGIPILLHIYIQMTFNCYKITNKRVSLKTGMFIKNERELRIQDIRSTAARTNIFGSGVVEFSTAATADAEVIFVGVRNSARIRDIVKHLQK